MNTRLAVYSGKCFMGVVGEPTEIKDSNGDELFVGDIVSTYVKGSYIGSLTVVVLNDPSLYGGEPDTPRHFVMGIKSVDFLADGSDWTVIRLKKWQDVIDGERWPDYGFNYKAYVDTDASKICMTCLGTGDMNVCGQIEDCPECNGFGSRL